MAYQSLFAGEDVGARIAALLPALPRFRHDYVGAISVIDWDHRLPSQTLALRIYGYYSDDTLEAGLEAYDDRLEQIAERDKYPEFDVPDFDAAGRRRGLRDGAVAPGRARPMPAHLGLAADDRVAGRRRPRSPWPRPRPSSSAWCRRRRSGRRYLGDLEAVSWTPPCESQHDRWTLDVWYLLAFDGRVGTGRSFLCDLEANQVVAVRDFSVRTG